MADSSCRVTVALDLVWSDDALALVAFVGDGGDPIEIGRIEDAYEISAEEIEEAVQEAAREWLG